MTPAPSETAELIIRLRQQLILAQVRIMELEDERDRLAPRLTDIEGLLAAAQKLADGKIDEAAHLGGVLADTQAHAAGLQQQLAGTGADLAATRARLAQAETAVTAAEQALGELRGEIAAMKSSRRWRWTAWLG
jgi:predicted  nucleic acid-binding Zn-ribbon protein